MQFTLNSEQAKGLANFFFDVAKGLVLGGLGFAAVTTIELKFLSMFLSFVSAFVCVKVALSILEEVE